MAAICLWIKSMLEVKLKNLGLMLIEEISGQLSTDSVVCLVAMILMHINSEKRKVGQEKYKMYNLKRKIVSRNVMLQPSLVLKDITNLKKSLIQNGIKRGNPRARSYSANPRDYERKMPEGYPRQLKQQLCHNDTGLEFSKTTSKLAGKCFL